MGISPARKESLLPIWAFDVIKSWWGDDDVKQIDGQIHWNQYPEIPDGKGNFAGDPGVSAVCDPADGVQL